METRTGIITFESGNGWFFCEDFTDHYRVFVHMRNVIGNRYLHVNDLITFDRIPSTRQPGKFEAINVVYADHVGGGEAVNHGR